MSKNRVLLPLCGLVAALLVAGAAIAAATATTSATVKAASAEFTATTVSNVHNVTCTGKNGDSFQWTSAVYKGTSTSQDARLSGPITITAQSFLDTTSGLGVVRGAFSINGTGAAGVTGALTGVLSNGSLSGFVRGLATDPAGGLSATLSGAFSQGSGFSAGGIGSPSTGGGAIVRGGCPQPTP